MIARRALVLLAGVLLLAGCGSSSGGSSSSSSDTTATQPPQAGSAAADTTPTTSSQTGLKIKAEDPSKYLRGSSVGFGEGPPPSFAPAVTKAAKAAGCTLRADVSAVGVHTRVNDIVPLHVDDPDYSKVPRPPTNGHHKPIWADWGFYQQPVPYGNEVHNLEHGGVIVHLGLELNRAAGIKVLRLWAASPPFLLIVPGLPADVSRQGATVTSWQRAMVCKKWNPRVLNAIRTYRDTYRGTGPEQVPSLNTGTTEPGLPKPVLPNPTGG